MPEPLTLSRSDPHRPPRSGLAAALVMVAGVRAMARLIGPAFLALRIVIAISPVQGWLLRKGLPRWLSVLALVRQGDQPRRSRRHPRPACPPASPEAARELRQVATRLADTLPSRSLSSGLSASRGRAIHPGGSSRERPGGGSVEICDTVDTISDSSIGSWSFGRA